MNLKTKLQNIGKSNYDSNLSINQEIETIMSQYSSLLKERFLQILDNFFLLNIKEKLAERRSLILKMQESVSKCIENSNEKIQPSFIISENSVDLIKTLHLNFFNFKLFSDRIKNEVNFKDYESNFKQIFHTVFELIDQIYEVLSFYDKVFHGFSAEAQKKFVEQISFLFTDLEAHLNSISV